MVVKRKISTQRYITAGAITLLLFVLAFSLGMIFDSQRVQSVQKEYAIHDLDYRSLQLQYSLLNVFSTENGCSAFDVAMGSAVSELSQSLEQVQQYEDMSASQKKNFVQVQRRYTLDNIRYWELIKEAEGVCTIDKLPILYFFSSSSCSHCSDQGVILTYFKKIYGDRLLVFPIDADLSEDEPVVQVLMSGYNVTSYPSIVVLDKKYEGVVSQEQLGELIKQKLK